MDKDEHRARNAAQLAEDAADGEFFANLPTDRCAVDECDRLGATEYRVAPRGICDPGEEERWPVVRFCKLHMQEIMDG
jgi:hypothetical protein